MTSLYTLWFEAGGGIDHLPDPHFRYRDLETAIAAARWWLEGREDWDIVQVREGACITGAVVFSMMHEESL